MPQPLLQNTQVVTKCPRNLVSSLVPTESERGEPWERGSQAFGVNIGVKLGVNSARTVNTAVKRTAHEHKI